MRKFNVRVNGKTYEIEIEESGAVQQNHFDIPMPQTQAVTASEAPAAPAPSAPKTSKISGETVKSPMPGTILEIKVSEGQTVKAGDTILILEAMKMENEIVAPKGGTVYLTTAKGTVVSAGDDLFTLA